MAEDFMPLLGWDYVELWVGNAKQAAYFYEHAIGLHAHRVRGARDGRARPRVVRARAGRHPLRRHDARCARSTRSRGTTRSTATASATSRSRSPTRRRRTAQAVQRGARGVVEPTRVEDEFGDDRASAIATYGDTIHTFVNRADYAGPFMPGYVSVSANGHARRRRRPPEHRPHRRQRRAREDEPLGRVLRERLRDDEHPPLRRRPDPDRVLGAHVEGHVGRRGQDQVPDQRAGRGQAQEPDRGVHRVLRRRRRAAHRARVDQHRRARSRR